MPSYCLLPEDDVLDAIHERLVAVEQHAGVDRADHPAVLLDRGGRHHGHAAVLARARASGGRAAFPAATGRPGRPGRRPRGRVPPARA